MLAFPGSIIVSLYIQRSLIHYFPRFTLCPFLSLLLEMHWCFLSFMDIPHFHSPFSPLIPASFGAHVLCHGAVLVQAVKPCKGLCALTFKGNPMFIWTCFVGKLSFGIPKVYQSFLGLQGMWEVLHSSPRLVVSCIKRQSIHSLFNGLFMSKAIS